MDINSVIGACRESFFLSLVPSIMEFILYSYCYNVCIFPRIELESCIYNCPAESIKLSWIFSIQNSLHILLSIFNTINTVFNIFYKVLALRSILVGTRTFSTGYKVLQVTNPLYKGSKALQVRLGGINDNLWGHCKSMLASMTISSTSSTMFLKY